MSVVDASYPGYTDRLWSVLNGVTIPILVEGVSVCPLFSERFVLRLR